MTQFSFKPEALHKADEVVDRITEPAVMRINEENDTVKLESNRLRFSFLFLSKDQV